MPKLKTYSVSTVLPEGSMAFTPIGDHEFVLDQPVTAGGTDKGPTPIDAFLSTISSCLGTISRIVAKQKGITLKKIEFNVSGEIDLDILLGRSEEGRAGFQSIKIEANLESPDLDDDGKMEFLQEVDRRCPVSETVLNGSSLDITLLEPIASS
tara:strand:- start:740 stop:1198 length:459 start_codon:yes stop_codon:yes gene_type:complete